MLRPSTDVTYLAAVRKKIMDWMDLKSVTVWQFFCHCQWSGPGMTTSLGNFAVSFTLSGHPYFVRNGLELLAEGLTV